MYIAIKHSPAGIDATLEDVPNCGEFHVLAPAAVSADSIQHAVAGTSRTVSSTEGDVGIPVAWILEEAGAWSEDAAWCASFAKMVTYAKSKGWADANGEVIQAHIVRHP